MSDKLNRSPEGFHEYDSMSIQELEAILRADAEGPDRDESDVDEILYVMEVLARKRREAGVAGKTALEAYQQFQQHYLSTDEDRSDPPKPAPSCRRLLTIAAVAFLVIGLTVTVSSLGLNNLWNSVATWAEETFSFSMGVNHDDPTPSDELQYESLQMVVAESNPDIGLPKWIPERFTFSEIIIDQTPRQDSYLAVYLDGDSMLKISVQLFLIGHPEQIEQSDQLIEKLTESGTDYYIFQNNGVLQAAWLEDTCECYIAGDITIEEIKQMISSIEKG